MRHTANSATGLAFSDPRAALHRWVLFAIVTLWSGASGANINGFQFNGIDPVGSVALNDRIGKTSASTDHRINIEDCKAYTGSSIEIMWSLTRVPTAGTKYVVKMSKPGGSCSTTSLSDLGGTCYEEYLVSEKTLDVYTNVKFSVALDPLMGGDCGAGTDRVTNIYIILEEAGIISAETIAFEVDLKAPAAPTLGEPKEGDQNVLVTWSDAANSGETGLRYRVYWSPSPFDDSNRSEASRSDAVTGKSYQVSGLENGIEYWFGVVAVDENDNESPLSAVSSAMPVPSYDLFEYYKEQGGREQGGFCFIATAAYGSPMAREVMTLRAFRDRVLLKTPGGRLFVETYYALSPPLAQFIAGRERLRAVARGLLWPLVWTVRAVGVDDAGGLEPGGTR